MSTRRDIDLVVYGATGLTGRQAAARAADTLADGKTLAIAGRNERKLAEVAKELGRDVEILVADSADEDAVGALAARARVVATTVGPYVKYGTPLFAACVAAKTAYVDITGEPHWVRGLIIKHHEQARADGTVLVPFSGYDSVPGDLGTFLVAEHLRARHGQRLARAHTQYRPSRAGYNGGTVATMLAIRDADRETRRAVFDPYAMCPDDDVPAALRARDADLRGPIRAPDGRGFDAPFLMAVVNTRVVRRSAALFRDTEHAYADAMQYRESMATRGRTPYKALKVTATLGAIAVLLKRRRGRALIERFSPAPGEGPTEAEMNNGKTRSFTYGEGDGGARAKLSLSYDGDPGNRFTVLCLTECARILVEEPERCGHGVPGQGGVLTPAVAFGQRLAERLREHGVRLTIEDL